MTNNRKWPMVNRMVTCDDVTVTPKGKVVNPIRFESNRLSQKQLEMIFSNNRVVGYPSDRLASCLLSFRESIANVVK